MLEQHTKSGLKFTSHIENIWCLNLRPFSEIMRQKVIRYKKAWGYGEPIDWFATGSLRPYERAVIFTRLSLRWLS